MNHSAIEGLVKALAPIVGEFVGKAISPLGLRLKALEEREPVKGEKGADGKDGVDGAAGGDGIDGKDGAPGLDGKDGAPGKAGIDGTPGRDGVDGKDGALGLDGKDGAPGKDGLDGKDGPAGVDGAPGRDGVDGKDADPVLVAEVVAAEVAKAVADIPPAKDGPPGKNGADGEMSLAPDDVAAQIAKAISLVAESPTIERKSSPLVLNVSSPSAERLAPSRKTITTRRDVDGNLVADVVEHVT